MPTISSDKVCFVALMARELEAEDPGMPSDASNETDDGFRSVLTDEGYASAHRELAAYIEAMDIDEQAELVALMWVGRGEYGPDEWDNALTQARSRREGPTSRYLLGSPLLASFLEGGLAEFGESCERYAADRQ